jgi:acetyl esterase/lipase
MLLAMNSMKWTMGWFLAGALTCVAQVKKPDPVDEMAVLLEPSRRVIYKTTPQKPLQLSVFEPAGFAKTDKRAAFVTIHGGGWRGGVPRRMYPFADYFAKQGMVGISVEYRLAAQKPTPGGLTPFDCVQDVKSVIRYLKKNAAEFGIDPEKIVVSGGSAGGHLAVATALFEAVNDPQDDLKVSTMPAAMVLLFPVIDTSAEIGYGNALLGDRWKEIDPNSHVRSGLPPTITFHGTGDTVTPFAGAEKFHQAMKAAGNESELVIHEGGVHGYLMFDRALLEETLEKSTAFLRRHSFIK